MAAITGLVNQLVDAPPVGQLRYGLFSVASSNTLDVRGIGAGISFLTDHCGGAQVYDANCVTHPTKVFVEGSDLIEAEPFWVYAKKHCGTVGRTASEMDGAVRQQLLSGEQTVVEDVLWDGGGLTNVGPSLTGSGATVVTPTADGAGAAIAALEAAAYGAPMGPGYRGVIHVNVSAYAALAYSGILHQEAGVWRTNMGTAVVFGAGYDITGPADVAPAAGFAWAFFTSAVHMYRSEIMVPDVTQTMDRTLNQWTATAERVYAVTWECPETWAVQVPVAAPAVATAPAAV